MQGCGVEQAGAGGRGIVAAGIEMAVLPPTIWAASVADLPQDLPAPHLVLSCGAEWVDLECSCCETHRCVLCVH